MNGKQYYDGYNLLEGLVLALGRDGTFSRVGCFTQEYRGDPFFRIIADKVGVEYSTWMLKKLDVRNSGISNWIQTITII